MSTITKEQIARAASLTEAEYNAGNQAHGVVGAPSYTDFMAGLDELADGGGGGRLNVSADLKAGYKIDMGGLGKSVGMFFSAEGWNWMFQ